MSDFNKSYRIRTEVGKDTQLHVKLDQKYDVLEIMSLKINQENAYKLHTSNYGVIAGRVLANGAFGIPNAKVSVFINIDDNDINDVIKSVLYPYNTTNSKDKDGIRYNLLPNEQVTDCHTIIGTFPEKQYALDNDSVLEIFEKYYKYTTKTNNAGDYMIFGVPTGSQTIHVDIDLSDIGILSQKPRDMVYKGYNINQFENPNKFKHDTNLNSLTQVVSQDNIAEVIPFWGDTEEGTIGITRCDIDVQYKFEPTCVFMGSVVSDTSSNGISKKCIPSPDMGAMDELTTGSGTIEMIRKKPDGSVEEFQVQGTQLINGDGVWCYQIPMNLDYMMTDEFGNMVPTNDPNKGIPTRTKVRFRISMQDFDSDSVNIFRGKMLVPHNPNIYSDKCEDELDYQFGTMTKEESYRDLFWNGVYTVKSYIPRIQKGINWKNSKFTGFKRVNYYGDKNPIPYNNIRIRIPFMYTILCVLIKALVRITGFVNWVFRLMAPIIVKEKDENKDKSSGSFLSLSGELCNTNLDNLCIIPGVKIEEIANKSGDGNGVVSRKTLLGMAIIKHYQELDGPKLENSLVDDERAIIKDEQSLEYKNRYEPNIEGTHVLSSDDDSKNADDKKYWVSVTGIRVTDKVEYLFQCIEMNLAQEYKVIQFDFYNDWINGLLYIPRWARNITKKHTFIFPSWTWGGKVKACNENYKRGNRNLVQQCALSYNLSTNNVLNDVGCTGNNGKLRCHKNKSVRKNHPIFNTGGIVKSIETLKSQYVYYFKPYEYSKQKNVRLFATDIVLLGTLNECDRWGIPNNLNEMVSSTYQLPPNMPLTDSDLEGNDYETDWNANEKIEMFIKEHKAKITEIKLNKCYKGINPMEEDGNYTEIAGIDWSYNGPLQVDEDGKVNGIKPTDFFKPGGHFLGITCRNSETNIKSCVNLTRICEHGVWMSQRQELNIPSPNASDKTESMLAYATVPSGLIAKDEISSTDYRRIFASMNSNRLRTVIDKNTGYPVYDFIYSHPNGFGGELSSRVSAENKNYNRTITTRVTEKYYDYVDDDYYERSNKTITEKVDEVQIMRTNEFIDKEYVKFRYGLSESEYDSRTQRQKRFLISNNTEGSIPMYNNSFYFYFGLRDGKTAIDELKRQYYAVCEKQTLSVQTDNSLNITSLTIVYDGVCSNDPKGEISFYVKTDENEYGDNGISITLLDETGNIVDTAKAKHDSDKVRLTKLPAGVYNLYLETETKNLSDSFQIEVKRVNVTAEIYGVSFKRDVSKLSSENKFRLEDRTNDGGYICIKNNLFVYEKGIDVDINNEDDNENSDIDIVDGNVFDSGYIKRISIRGINNNVLYMNDTNDQYKFRYYGDANNKDKSVIHEIRTNANGDYMIPVPFEDETYEVSIITYTGNRCKPVALAINRTPDWSWKVGEVTIRNGVSLGLTYNDIPHQTYIAPYSNNGGTINSYDGWWNPTGTRNWLHEELYTQWNIKEALYMNKIDSSSPHSVSIKNTGGNAPYTETVGGMKEDMRTTEGLTRSNFENVIIPTINYLKDGKRRLNFSYQVVDGTNQVYPPSGSFVFPVIYKPFFMEMGVWYFNETNKYYLIGNVYNGRTWDYKNEAYNDSSLNGIKIANLCSIAKNDTIMELDEILPDGTKVSGGGYDYAGPYFKYNGRKTKVTREIEPITYGLSVDKKIDNFSLTIGCSHDENGAIYSDSTSVSSTDMEFFNLIFEGILDESGNYLIQVKTNSKTSVNIIPFLTTKYTYPIDTPNKRPDNIDENLKRYLIDNSLIANSSISYLRQNGILKNDMININAIQNVTDNIGKLYYLITPTTNPDITGSNEESNLKCVSVSNLINLESLSQFYPLDIKVSGTDIRKIDGTYETKVYVEPSTGTKVSTSSQENFKNKRFDITFYKIENGVKVALYTAIGISDSTGKPLTIDITPYRTILGLTGSNQTRVNYYYDVYTTNNEKAPSTYLIDREVGAIFTYTDNYTSNNDNEEEQS